MNDPDDRLCEVLDSTRLPAAFAGHAPSALSV